MKRSSLLRFFIISLIISIGFGFASFYTLRALNESSTSEVRKHMILFSAQIVEGSPYLESVKNEHFRAGKRAFGSDLWVISGDGTILATNSTAVLPISWNSVKKPAGVHELTFLYRPFRLVSDLTLVKLDIESYAVPGVVPSVVKEVYLLIGSKKRPTFGGPLWIQTSFLIFVTGLAVLIALAFITVYLKNKSLEARYILSRMEKGDLKARFEIKRVDEIGSLMLDFNRMASEIERLVHQVQQTEKARKNLLEELSHDIRTPLTSLKTSIETLSDHLDEMTKDQQREFLNVSRVELAYFLHLIEDLFFIADLGEPRYKQTTQEVDLPALIADEVKGRQAQSRNSNLTDRRQIDWRFEITESSHGVTILGDPILIQRLIKNSLDNASKFAESAVQVHVVKMDASVHILVEDDGVGISDEAIAVFGQRKKQRFELSGRDESISLGLGSVIMKTIVELHGGDLQIERIINRLEKGLCHGSRLILKLPK